MTRHDLTEQAVLDAIVDSDANMALIARRLRTSAPTAKKRIARWPSTQIAYELAKPALAILAYRNLRVHVEENNLSACKYVLDNEGGPLGYGKAITAAAAAVTNVNVNIHNQDPRELTDDQLSQIAAGSDTTNGSDRTIGATSRPAESA